MLSKAGNDDDSGNDAIDPGRFAWLGSFAKVAALAAVALGTGAINPNPLGVIGGPLYTALTILYGLALVLDARTADAPPAAPPLPDRARLVAAKRPPVAAYADLAHVARCPRSARPTRCCVRAEPARRPDLGGDGAARSSTSSHQAPSSRPGPSRRCGDDPRLRAVRQDVHARLGLRPH